MAKSPRSNSKTVAATADAPAVALPPLPEGIHLHGVRHHGPGCARSLRQALDALQPDCVLIEGPPEAEPLIPCVLDPDLCPPVALLSHATDEPRRARWHPFAQFSPEWQALQWAASHQVPVRFIDLPIAHTLALEAAEEEALKQAAEAAESSDATSVSSPPTGSSSSCPPMT